MQNAAHQKHTKSSGRGASGQLISCHDTLGCHWLCQGWLSFHTGEASGTHRGKLGWRSIFQHNKSTARLRRCRYQTGPLTPMPLYAPMPLHDHAIAVMLAREVLGVFDEIGGGFESQFFADASASCVVPASPTARYRRDLKLAI